MKKVIITIFSLSLGLGVVAQGKFKLGIQAAGTLSTLNLGALSSGTSLNPLIFGAPTLVSELKLFNGLSFRPGVGYLRSGGTTNATSSVFGNSITSESRYSIDNLSIPLDLTIPIKVKENRILINIGPNISYGLGGNLKNTITQVIGGVATTFPTTTGDINFGTSSGELNRTNLLGKIGAGFQTKGGLEANASYALGLSDLNNVASIFKSNTIALGVAYFFVK
jgi:Outer membrane protein beta-barrel domain